MENSLIKGIILGLTLSVLVGPLLFALMQTAMERGFRAGLLFACGIWVSDFFYIALLLYALNRIASLTERPNFEIYASIAGALILTAFGAGLIIQGRYIGKSGRHIIQGFEPSHWWRWMLKGMLINGFNPFTIFFWVGMMAVSLPTATNSNGQTALFLGGLMGTVMCFDVLKAALAKKISSYLTPLVIYRVRIATGLVLIIFGFSLVGRLFI